MNENEIGMILGTQLVGLSRNSNYSYVNHAAMEFSHLTEKGKVLMAELIDALFIKAAEYDHQRCKLQAEQLIMDNLKK